jgi:hypothetical protein
MLLDQEECNSEWSTLEGAHHFPCLYLTLESDLKIIVCHTGCQVWQTQSKNSHSAGYRSTVLRGISNWGLKGSVSRMPRGGQLPCKVVTRPGGARKSR